MGVPEAREAPPLAGCSPSTGAQARAFLPGAQRAPYKPPSVGFSYTFRVPGPPGMTQPGLSRMNERTRAALSESPPGTARGNGSSTEPSG